VVEPKAAGEGDGVPAPPACTGFEGVEIRGDAGPDGEVTIICRAGVETDDADAAGAGAAAVVVAGAEVESSGGVDVSVPVAGTTAAGFAEVEGAAEIELDAVGLETVGLFAPELLIEPAVPEGEGLDPGVWPSTGMVVPAEPPEAVEPVGAGAVDPGVWPPAGVVVPAEPPEAVEPAGAVGSGVVVGVSAAARTAARRATDQVDDTSAGLPAAASALRRAAGIGEASADFDAPTESEAGIGREVGPGGGAVVALGAAGIDGGGGPVFSTVVGTAEGLAWERTPPPLGWRGALPLAWPPCREYELVMTGMGGGVGVATEVVTL
jgi:hypothetical protein